MFAKTIIDSDAFLEMPLTSQLLYFHLSMRADDEGFINKPKSIMRLVGCKDDDILVLIGKGFLIPFESGVVVIKHWKMHNYIRGDRLQSTEYIEERSKLYVKDNNAYSLNPQSDRQLADTCPPTDGIGKDRLGKESNIGATPTRFTPPTLEEVSEYCKSRNNGVDAQRFIDFYEMKGWMVGKSKMKDWKAAVRTWEKKEDKPAEQPKSKPKRFEQVIVDGEVFEREVTE